MSIDQRFIATIHEAAIRADEGDDFIVQIGLLVLAGVLSGEWETYVRRALLVQQQEGAKQ